ncbi:FAD-dependent oxidoreductase [Acidocella aminolytica]|uniref:FAD binding dehydrogenase n=2 Tax=Acidocella TaxID=50709 RepID=A0A0D6PMU0_9PROT|nr:FAD-dependent oxidoreductase [Acidocella aminolytica]GAN82109.1 FAD binding dehydrogenase [Acidocella aminolytica 101 = DSM 11237]SHF62364.1 Succinate dehydrogenase/fumarate reductase, flavoprotein subunit [Acidocella aminolytica 101 = DSM 11237]
MAGPISSGTECDVLVIGAGAGGLSTAITACKHGLNVVVIEKAPVFGGTMAFSGGVLWIPGNKICPPGNKPDSRAKALSYLKHETGNFFDEAAINAFLDHGPEMLDFFQRETEVKFLPTLYPDYHPDAPGGMDVGRSVLAAPYNAAELGKELHRLRPPLRTITFMGMMFNSSNADIKHFFNATKSVSSFLYVTRRLTGHIKELIRYKRGVQVTSGNALAARLAKTAFNLNIPIYTNTSAQELLWDGNRVTGARVHTPIGPAVIIAKRAVVIAAGGFPHDKSRISKHYPHLRRGGEHLSPIPTTNTGDGISLAESAGGSFISYPNASAWMPVSAVPRKIGEVEAFPHLLDRYKPGVIAVTSNGERFTNESNSYHDFGEAMIASCEAQDHTSAFLICDHAAIRKYGLGFVKPAPLPLTPHLRNAYLKRGKTLAELAKVLDIDACQLEYTVARFNKDAESGRDTEFGRGSTSFNRYLGDPDHRPSPNIAPIQRAPFYAVKLIMGDLGTFNGLETTVEGQILNKDHKPIPGLYAAGNDRASIMSGNYPGAGITLGPILTFGYITGRHLATTSDV